MKPFSLLLVAAGLLAVPPTKPTPGPSDRYLVYVVSESSDQIQLVSFGPDSARVERAIKTGLLPTEINGPHGVIVSPDGKYYYVTVAHGSPFGTIWKYATGTDRVIGRATLGMFPATVDVSPDGQFLYVANFNFHGDMVPSTVSIISAEEMIEVARPVTCTMPHGSRFNPQGTKHYSACMMDDMLVEIDPQTFAVSRHFRLTRGKEMGMPGAPGAHSSHGAMTDATCSPTWAQPSGDGSKVYVACSKADSVLEIDADRWQITRRMAAGKGVYNLAVTHDGRLLIGTNKKGQSLSVLDLATGQEVARIPTKRRIPSGVAVSSDDRYAFATDEGVGAEPGTVEIVDLKTFQVVATVDVGLQAGGIAFWKVEPGR